MMHSGSCLCGAVRYEIDGDLGPMGMCHCKRCQKASGTAFNAVAEVATADFRLEGRDAVVEYLSSPGVYRAFCGRCGSPLYSRRDATPDFIRLRIGTLDTPVTGRPAAQIFTAEKAEWHDLDESIPSYAERPPSPA
jgi:hypothetical protein